MIVASEAQVAGSVAKQPVVLAGMGRMAHGARLLSLKRSVKTIGKRNFADHLFMTTHAHRALSACEHCGVVAAMSNVASATPPLVQRLVHLDGPAVVIRPPDKETTVVLMATHAKLFFVIRKQVLLARFMGRVTGQAVPLDDGMMRKTNSDLVMARRAQLLSGTGPDEALAVPAVRIMTVAARPHRERLMD